VRVTRSAAGIVVDGPSDGRGAWLCRATSPDEVVAAACLDAARAKRAFARAWRRDLDTADEQAISELVGRRADGDEHPDAH